MTSACLTDLITIATLLVIGTAIFLAIRWDRRECPVRGHPPIDPGGY